MTKPIRKEFTESYVSITLDSLYAWWQTDSPNSIRLQAGHGNNVSAPINRQDLISLAKELEK